jgi:twinkle protein
MSRFIKTHIPCPKCGSSDAAAINSDGWRHCFSCNEREKVNEATEQMVSRTPSPQFDVILTALAKATPRAIPDRKLTPDTVNHYRVVVEDDRQIYPYYSAGDSNTPVASKTRLKGKVFLTAGDVSEAGLFGQQAFSAGGKYVVLCEGELDAMAAYQMMGGYPAVSVRSGASGALRDCKQEYEWLDSFECIVVCFDGDEPGVEAAQKVAELFGGKSKVMKHVKTYKDACDYLKADDAATFNNVFWKAETFTPDGIVCGSELWEVVNSPVESAAVFYPFDGLNKITYGIRPAEMVTVCAGSGLGKSQFLREIIFAIKQSCTDSIGLMMMEESVRRTALSLMSLAANKPLHLPTTEASDDERKQAFDQVLGDGQIFLFDHFGSSDVDNIVARVRYMAKAMDCKYVFIDHVSIIVSAQSNGDERKAIDEIMTKLRTLVQETSISLFVVSHLKRPESKGHEEGATTSLAQLRGSASIAQLSDIVIGLERNAQAEDTTERNTTRVRVLKNRFSGETGKACSLLYSGATGRMEEYDENAL